MVRKATTKDIAAIYDISRENSIDTIETPDIGNQGFLVSDFSLADYRHFIEEGYTILVADHKGHVAGYALLADEEHYDPNDLLCRQIHSRAGFPFVVVKQVCVGLRDRGKGIGTELYADKTLNDGRTVYAAVVDDSSCRNRRSMIFHEKLGFSPAFSFVGADKLQRMVYRRP